MNDPAIRKYLTPTTSAREYALMYAVLSELPVRFRKNVVYFAADGNTYATSPFLKANASRFSEPAIPPTAGCDNSGGVGTTCCNGIFIRHYSKTTTQMTQAAITTSTPCVYTKLNPGSTDGYLLLGANVFDTPGKPNVATYSVDAGCSSADPPGRRFRTTCPSLRCRANPGARSLPTVHSIAPEILR